MAKSDKLMIKNVRCVQVQLHEPKAYEEGDDAKYSIKIIIPKSDKVSQKAVNDFVKAAIQKEKWTPAAKKAITEIAILKSADMYNDNAILKDGDKWVVRQKESDWTVTDCIKGHYTLNVKKKGSFGPPLVVSNIKDEQTGKAKVIPGMEIEDQIQAGFWVNVQVQAYCYSKPKPGVTLQLIGVQKVKRDEVLSFEENDFEGSDDVMEDDVEVDPFAEE